MHQMKYYRCMQSKKGGKFSPMKEHFTREKRKKEFDINLEEMTDSVKEMTTDGVYENTKKMGEV